MNVEHPSLVVEVRSNWTLGAALGSAFPVDHKLHPELDECLSGLEPHTKRPDEHELARPVRFR